jgi:hypothetical protein
MLRIAASIRSEPDLGSASTARARGSGEVGGVARARHEVVVLHGARHGDERATNASAFRRTCRGRRTRGRGRPKRSPASATASTCLRSRWILTALMDRPRCRRRWPAGPQGLDRPRPTPIVALVRAPAHRSHRPGSTTQIFFCGGAERMLRIAASIRLSRFFSLEGGSVRMLASLPRSVQKQISDPQRELVLGDPERLARSSRTARCRCSARCASHGRRKAHRRTREA